MASKELLRIIDANSNRLREALRVIEDLLRFYYEEGNLTSKLKRLRHVVSKDCDSLLRKNLKGLKARNVGSDPGWVRTPHSEVRRGSVIEVLISNFRRAEESLRVLEEVSKLLDPGISRHFKRARFRTYQLEKECILRVQSHREGD